MHIKKQPLKLDMEQWSGSKLGKEYDKGCILSPCIFHLYAEYIMKNAGLDEAQAGIKTARRNINNIRYADDTTLTAENHRGTKEPLDEGEKSWFKTQHSKNEDHGIWSHHFMAHRKGKSGKILFS